MTKRKIEEDEEIELTLTDSGGKNSMLFVKNGNIEELRIKCRECLEITNKDANFEFELFYKSLVNDSIKYQLRSDKDLSAMYRHYQRNNAMNKIRIFIEGPTKLMKLEGNPKAKIREKILQKRIKIDNDLHQQQSTSSGNYNYKNAFEDLKIIKMDGIHKNERQKNNFDKLMFLLKNTNANLDFNNIQIHGKNFGEFEIRFGHLKVGQICRLVYDNGWAHVYFNFDSQMQNWLVDVTKIPTKEIADGPINPNIDTNRVLYFKDEISAGSADADPPPHLIDIIGSNDGLNNVHFHHINDGEILCRLFQLKNSNPIIMENVYDIILIGNKIDWMKLRPIGTELNLIHFDGLSAKQLLELVYHITDGVIWLYENCAGQEEDFFKYSRSLSHFKYSAGIVVEMVGIELIKSDFNWLPDPKALLFNYCKLLILKSNIAGDFYKSPQIAISAISNFLISEINKNEDILYSCSLTGIPIYWGSLQQNIEFIKCIPSFHATNESVTSDVFLHLVRELFFIPGRILCIDLKLLKHPELGISKYAEPMDLVCILFKDFIDATEKHPYLLFLKCPSTIVLPDFSLRCQNILGETFEMKQFVDNAGNREIKRKILWIERYFLDTSLHCLKNLSSPLFLLQQQNAIINNIITGDNNNINQSHINISKNV